MRVDIKKITSAINKISDLTSGDKQIPGVMLVLSENKLDVCYSDGHKSLIETIEVETDETDRMGKVAVELQQIARAISNCQPSGSIKVSEIYFKYNEKTITISAEQFFDLKDGDGNITDSKKMGVKKMDVLFTDPEEALKTKVLTRMDYNSIFESDGTVDEFDKKELMVALAKTSTENGRTIYFSTKTQSIFVSNTSHLTVVPISGYEVSPEDVDIIRGELSEQNNLTDETLAAAIANKKNRIHYSIVISTAMAKALIGVLGKTDAEKVYMHTKDKFCNIYVDSENERVGIWLEGALGNKAHIGALERYNALPYATYHVTFLTEFLSDSVKSALNSSKSEKITFKFVQEEDGVKLRILAGSASASTADTYDVLVENVYCAEGDTIADKEFNVSLKVFADMLSQIKTERTALDFDCKDGNTCIRLSEVGMNEMAAAYQKMRELTKQRCEAQGVAFEPTATPTPLDIRMSLRNETLITKQYAALSK